MASLIQNLQNESDRIVLGTLIHSADVSFPVVGYLCYGVQQRLVGKLLLLQNIAVSLTFKGFGVQDLIPAAGRGGKRNQDIGLS